jgi:hypothetical protein
MNTIPTISTIAAVACVYLFATAPAPLPEAPERSGSRNAVIPVSKLFDTVNLVNAKTRQIWTSRIVEKEWKRGSNSKNIGWMTAKRRVRCRHCSSG